MTVNMILLNFKFIIFYFTNRGQIASKFIHDLS